MATFVNDLRLTELATGEGSGTWGTTTNTNLELVAEAFSFGTEAITTNADTHTTTIADGSTDPGRSIFLKYTGTLDSTCTITIGPNTVSKLWLIENATSGSQTIIIKQGSGATITVPNGQTKAIYSDGAGSGAAMVDAFQDLSIPDLFIDDDLTFTSDSAVITFGADGDTTLTHTDGSGLTLNSTNKIMFNDASQFIQGSSATVLSLGATDEIDLTATLIDINGNADVSGTVTATGTSVFASLDISGDIDVDGTTNLDVVDIDGAVDFASTTAHAGNATFADNAKAIFGAGSDLQIFHDGSNSFITDAGTGSLFIRTATKTQLQNAGGTENYAIFNENGAVNLYHDNSEKLATTAAGIDVTGTVTATGTSVFASLDISGDIDVDGTTNLDVVDIDGALTQDGGAVFNEASADVDFRVESDGSTHMLFVDGGNDSVAIGNTSGGLASESASLIIGNREVFSEVVSNQLLLANNNYYKDGNAWKTVTANDWANIRMFSGGVQIHAGTSSTADETISNMDTTDEKVRIGTSELVINDHSGDYDVRIESDGNTHMLFVDAGNNRVGIGGTPSEQLHIQNANDAVVLIESTGSDATDDANVQLKTTNGTFTIQNDRSIGTSGALTFAGNTSNNIVINHDTGKVQVGTSTAINTATLSVAGSIAFDGTTVGSYVDASGWIDFQSSSDANKLRLHSGGDSGESSAIEISTNISGTQSDAISVEGGGTTVINQDSNAARDFRVESDSETHALFVDAGANTVNVNHSTGAKEGSAAGIQMQIGKGSAGGTAAQIFFDGSSANRGYVIGTVLNEYAIFDQISSGTFKKRMSLDDAASVFNEDGQDVDFRVESDSLSHALFVDAATGGVQFGESSSNPYNNLTTAHNLKGSSSTVGAAPVGVYNSTGTANCPALNILNRDTSTDSTNRFIQFYANVTSSSNTSMGGIVGNGADNVQFASISDVREKTNIESINGSLHKIKALNPVEFDWIASGEHCKAGFVAQEVEEVFPEFVVENMAGEGAEERKGLTGGMTGGIVAHLVKAIQEQQEQIEELKAEIAKLKGG